MFKNSISYLVLIFSVLSAYGQQQMPHVLSLKERAVVMDEILEDRLANLLPKLMEEQGVNLWLIITREYNEDPVFWSMRPSTWINARRRTIIAFYQPSPGEPLERHYLQKHGLPGYERAWTPEENPPKWYEEDQWNALISFINDKDPKNIALNISENFKHADGLATTDYRNLIKRLSKKYQDRIVEGGGLAVRWLETRTQREIDLYEHTCNIAHTIIAEAFSQKVITPGVTTVTDVRWWMRERIRELKLSAWFFPSVTIQRYDADKNILNSYRNNEEVIQYGDLLWCDFGITYLRLNTDTQENAYVLRPGETDVPDYLKKALAVTNRLQDILVSQFETGKTGNEITLQALDQMKSEGIDGTIYTHPIGYHGHGAGSTIGLSEKQEFIKGAAEWPLYMNTAYSIELNAKVPVAEFGNQKVRIAMEEEAIYTDQGVRFIDGRAKDWILIPRRNGHLGKYWLKE